MNEYDVVIIGGGAAGLSAALVLSRALRNVAVVDAGQPRNAPAAHLQGFLSRDGLSPRDLLAIGRREVTGYGGVLIDGRVTGIVSTGGQRSSFGVTMADGSSLIARRVLVTTGLRDELPDIPGVAERWGRDLLHCPYCHGYEVRDQPIGVLGGAPEAIQHAHLIRQWSSDVLLFARTDTVSTADRDQLAARGIGVIDGAVARLLVDDDHLSAIELATGQVVPRTAAFVRPGFVPNDTLLRSLGCVVDDNGWLVVDNSGRTSVRGVWAAGNAVNPRAQLITAAGEGSAAAIAINGDLVDEEVAASMTHENPSLKEPVNHVR